MCVFRCTNRDLKRLALHKIAQIFQARHLINSKEFRYTVDCEIEKCVSIEWYQHSFIFNWSTHVSYNQASANHYCDTLTLTILWKRIHMFTSPAPYFEGVMLKLSLSTFNTTTFTASEIRSWCDMFSPFFDSILNLRIFEKKLR